MKIESLVSKLVSLTKLVPAAYLLASLLTGSTLCAQTPLLDLSSGTSGWTTVGSVLSLSTTDSFTVGSEPYSITPSAGQNMFKIYPGDVYTVYGASAGDTALGLTSGTLSSLLTNNLTNFGYAQITFSNLAAGTYTFSWAYAAGDYQPYNDGALFSIAGVNGTTGQSVISLARTGTGASDQSGPSAGTLVLGSYGSTDWNTTAFTVATAGDYLVTFAAYNWSDETNDPYLFVAASEGSFTGTPAVSYGGSAVPEPSTYAAIFGLAALGFAAYRRRQKAVPVATT